MADLFNPIPAFNNRLQFPEAYLYNGDQVLAFLHAVATNPANYGAPVNHQADLQLLHDRINELRAPNGAKYTQPLPGQQFLRTGPPLAVDPTHPIPWPVNNIRERFFIIYDLLGMFLSLMGPSPPNATAKNYYLPLVVVYARWCSVLARSANTRPAAVHVVWASSDNHTWSAFLGASYAGFNRGRESNKVLVGTARHSYIQGILQAPWLNYGQSPSIDAHGNAGTNFGGCAELYPFLYVLGDPALKHNSFGISLRVPAVSLHAAYDGHDYWSLEPMISPCNANCQQLMQWYGVFDRLQHFQLWTT